MGQTDPTHRPLQNGLATPSSPHCKTSDTLDGVSRVVKTPSNAVGDLGAWVRRELIEGSSDSGHIARVIVHEINQWFKNTTDEFLPFEGHPNTGSERWDALIEGLAARYFHVRKLEAPAWARCTRLDEAWSPYDETVTDNSWHIVNVLNTPVELLDRGIVLSRTELVLI